MMAVMLRVINDQFTDFLYWAMVGENWRVNGVVKYIELIYRVMHRVAEISEMLNISGNFYE